MSEASYYNDGNQLNAWWGKKYLTARSSRQFDKVPGCSKKIDSPVLAIQNSIQTLVDNLNFLLEFISVKNEKGKY